MSAVLTGASNERRAPFLARWALCRTPAGTVETPAQLAAVDAAAWIGIAEPDTVAGALRSAGRWSLDGPAQRFDADDWWFRAEFDDTAPRRAADVSRTLAFGGLAGHCEVWLNDAPLLASENMHVAHAIDEPALQRTGNCLLMRFAALDGWLAARRPRPRWRAPMVENQQLRWTRNTLLGRTPGWSPPAAPVGPWRAIEWVEHRQLRVADLRLRCTLDGLQGRVELEAELRPIAAGARVETAQLVVSREGASFTAALAPVAPGSARFTATLPIPEVARWWPHTHGEPALYAAELRIRTTDAGTTVVRPLGRIGFRHLELDTRDGDFALRVNGIPVFCRGACWTPLDAVRLRSTPADCRRALAQCRDAGFNMLRLSGAIVAEEDHFFDACDALGLLVWQDFMFANMDYPADDPAFAASVQAEAGQLLARLHARPSLALLCGNSEVSQQAAMWGAARGDWSPPLFERELAELAHAWCPGVPYWPSSAHGGAFPHQNDAGTTAYYGVGAYRRPLADARLSGVVFASECLAFANVPPESTLARLPGGGAALRVHQPVWKARAPRDLGAGWDFDDVRDHYLASLYGVDPVALRSSDPARHLALSRALGAELMRATFAEWRRAGSRCRGALVWFLRDLWAGAGWGLLDDRGVPKAAFHGLRQALAPRTLFLQDEGTNGLVLQLINEPAEPLEAQVDVQVYRDDGLCLHQASQPHRLEGRSVAARPVAGWFDTFIDLAHAYRFGPAEHAVVVATLRDAADPARPVIAQSFHFAEGLPARRAREIGLAADTRLAEDGSAEVRVRTSGLAQSVHFEVPGYVAEDEYFHLAPGASRVVRLVPDGSARALRGSVQALNSHAGAVVKAAS